MKLLSLTLRNFKGQTELCLEPDGNDLSIFGDNSAGKTTIADAFFWLLFDKDSSNRKDFEIKTIDQATGKPFKGLDHEVIAVFDIDGDQLTLQKSYKEKWVKSRGKALEEFSGHTTDYKVNGVPVQEKEFNSWVAGICDEKRFRLLTDPTYFNTVLKWDERRRILIDVCGDITDADVIAGNHALSGLPAILGRHKLEDYRKIIVARRKEANAEIGNIPIRIDELNRSLPEVVAVPDTQRLRDELQALSESKARFVAGGAVAEATKRLREVEGEIQQAQTKVREAAGADTQTLRNALSALENKRSTCQSTINRLAYDIETQSGSLQRLNSQLEDLRTQFRAAAATQFEWTGTDTCAACGQSLPAERVAEVRAKAEEEFNLAKAKRLEVNKEEGIALRKRCESIEATIAENKAIIETEKAKLEPLTAECEQLTTQVQAIPAPNFEVDPAYVALISQKASIEAEIAELRTGNSADIEKLEAQIQRLNEELGHAQQLAARANLRADNLKRIEQLEAQERTLAGEIERLDGELFLTEEFIRTKVKALTEKINSRFTIARFKLFEVQINGAINETCETTVDGVPYSSLNHGARVNVGLDIINALAEHHQFAPCVFIDNAESVTRILPTQGQQIRLIVSEPDKTLRVVGSQTQSHKEKQIA